MTHTRVPMTPAGQQRLRDELHELRDTQMPRVVKEIAAAREHGDLSENAEYHAAKERQGMIHARMKHIEDVLARGEVIDPASLSGDRVKFGANVTVLNIDTDEEKTYFIVGPEESDAERGHISVSSPLARSLLGRQAGDEVTVKLPSGTRVFELQSVSFG